MSSPERVLCPSTFCSVDPCDSTWRLGNKSFQNCWVPPPSRKLENNLQPAHYLHLHSFISQMKIYEILSSRYKDINGRDSTGRTALHKCAQDGNVMIARLLLQNEALVSVAASNGRRYLFLILIQ